MGKPVSRGKFNTGHGLLLMLLAAGLLFLSWYFFQRSFSFRHLQPDRFITAVLFTLLLVYFFIRALAAYNAVDIYRSHLKIKWLWGLKSIKVYPSDIDQFSISTTKICLRRHGTNILLITRLMDNDHELIRQLEQWHVKRKDSMRLPEDRLVSIILKIVACVLCMAVFYTSCMQYREPVSYRSLVKVRGHLSKPPRMDRGIDLKLEEYPAISFHIAVEAELTNYPPGTPAAFWITRDAYQRARRFSWSRVEVFEAELNGSKILELNKYNREADETAAGKKGWAFPLILVLVIVFFALRVSPTR